MTGGSAAGGVDGGAPRPAAGGDRGGASGRGVDVAGLAERVYRLLRDEVRREQARRGARGLPRAGA